MDFFQGLKTESQWAVFWIQPCPSQLLSINTPELLIQVLIQSNTAYPAGLERKSVIKMPLNSYVAFISKSPKEKGNDKKTEGFDICYSNTVQFEMFVID